MKDSIFYKYKNKREHDILYKPRDGEEMTAATLNKTPIYKYSELVELGDKHGANRLLSKMFQRSDSNIILLQDPTNMDSGHWISVSRNPKKKEFYFFSTYGGKPDVEKNEWMTEDDLRESGQLLNIFNDGLREAQNHGWKIYYNDFPYQKSKDNTAVCGIYTAAFLRSGLNPDDFEKETLDLCKQGINPAIFYFDKYFR
jgi:hypothetical protein